MIIKYKLRGSPSIWRRNLWILINTMDCKHSWILLSFNDIFFHHHDILIPSTPNNSEPIYENYFFPKLIYFLSYTVFWICWYGRLRCPMCLPLQTMERLEICSALDHHHFHRNPHTFLTTFFLIWNVLYLFYSISL